MTSKEIYEIEDFVKICVGPETLFGLKGRITKINSFINNLVFVKFDKVINEKDGLWLYTYE